MRLARCTFIHSIRFFLFKRSIEEKKKKKKKDLFICFCCYAYYCFLKKQGQKKKYFIYLKIVQAEMKSIFPIPWTFLCMCYMLDCSILSNDYYHRSSKKRMRSLFRIYTLVVEGKNNLLLFKMLSITGASCDLTKIEKPYSYMSVFFCRNMLDCLTA